MLWWLPLAAALAAPTLGWCLWSMGTVTPAMAAHGAMMLTAWGLLMPAGAVVARYYKVLPGQDFPRVHNVLVSRAPAPSASANASPAPMT